jgi:hypothetical protein
VQIDQKVLLVVKQSPIPLTSYRQDYFNTLEVSNMQDRLRYIAKFNNINNIGAWNLMNLGRKYSISNVGNGWYWVGLIYMGLVDG